MPLRRTSSNRLMIEVGLETPLAEALAREAVPITGMEAVIPGDPDNATPGWNSLEIPAAGAGAHPWDEAHRAVAAPETLSLEAAPLYAEPDFVQEFPYQGPDDLTLESFGAAGPCDLSGPVEFWPPQVSQALFPFAWHLDDSHSGLRSAREHVGDPTGRRVRIAILDTGYDPEHVTLPVHFRADLQRNFAGGPLGDARDPNASFPTNQPGHGTATMALLAGRRFRHAFYTTFDDFLGGAPHAEVVPVRIADSVIHFGSAAMAQGIEYAITAGCDVVSISMGGVPARSWASAVNRAYEAGVAICAAAGNRFGPSPPSSIVYPARFGRVVAVCGVTQDKTPYYREGLHRMMQGCFGPPSKMGTAMAAYTPNTPWAMLGCHSQVTVDGGGTSSATPQVAAAAALWLQANLPAGGFAGWQKVEAVRHALFSSADKAVPDVAVYFGQGLLRARRALDVAFRVDLPRTPADRVSFPWLRLAGVLELAPGAGEAEEPQGRDLMYEVEALQIYEQSPDLQRLAGGADPQRDRLDPFTLRHMIRGLAESPFASNALRERLAEVDRGL